jgi:hypothetical protein
MNSVGDEQKIVAAILRAWQICGSETPLHRGAVVDDVDVDVSVVVVVVVAVVVVVLVLLLAEKHRFTQDAHVFFVAE